LITGLACLVNPAFLEGAMVPLNIFKRYGYMLAENQSVIFMHKRFLHNLIYPHIEITTAVLLASFLLVCRKNNLKEFFIPLALAVFFGALAWKTNRAMATFGMFFVPLVCFNLNRFVQNFPDYGAQLMKKGLFVGGLIIILIGICMPESYFSCFRRILQYQAPSVKNAIKGRELDYFLKTPQAWSGLLPKINASAEFFKRTGLKGPIFNNYDIGGYLIYHLSDQEKLFVDNRPEAYSISFFEDIYVPMQEREEEWMRVDEKYQLNVIYFYRHDITPWAQPFLIRRISDPQWAPVFADGYTLILVKRNEQNKKIIDLFEMPQSMFIVTKNR